MSTWNSRDTPAVDDEIAVYRRPVLNSEPEAALGFVESLSPRLIRVKLVHGVYNSRRIVRHPVELALWRSDLSVKTGRRQDFPDRYALPVDDEKVVAALARQELAVRREEVAAAAGACDKMERLDAALAVLRGEGRRS